uniref:Uncharacterized protein n=1 Tax=Naja naja TaxID=35670 RepID=A0A8C6XDJ5_NAJNA
MASSVELTDSSHSSSLLIQLNEQRTFQPCLLAGFDQSVQPQAGAALTLKPKRPRSSTI